MDDVVKRIAPSKSTLLRLFAKSGNNCAFDGCPENLFNEEGVFIAEICHIEAAMPGGERFNKNMTNEQRAHEDNLILLCHKHHKITDDVNAYNVERLQELKRKHEKHFLNTNQSIYTEKNITTFFEKFNEVIIDKLKSVENVLFQIRTLERTDEYFNKPKGKLDPSKELFEKHLIYFTENEIESLVNIKTQFVTNTERFALITGHPSSGKTIAVLSLSLQLQEETFKTYYFSFGSQHNLADIKDDIIRLQAFKAVIVFDDIHKNLPLAHEVFNFLFSFPNLSSIFVSRDLSEELQEIGESAFSLYETIKLGLNLSQKSTRNKFEGVINAFRNSNSTNQGIGDLTKILNFCHFNLLKLKLFLETWRDEEFHKPLSEINEREFNKSLKKRYLSFNESIKEDDIKKYSSVYSYGIDFHFVDGNKTKDVLEQNGIITKNSDELQLYQFWHAKFAELLLLCILETQPTIDKRHLLNNLPEIRANQLLTYIKHFPIHSTEGFQYPLNMLEIVSLLSQQKERQVLQQILNDHYNLISKYLDSEHPKPREIKELIKHLRFSSLKHFETIIDKYVITQNFLQELLITENGYDIFSYILLSCYKSNLSKTAAKLTSLISDDSLKQLVQSAPLNSLTLSTRIFKNYYPKLSLQVLNSISLIEWGKKLKPLPAFIISNSLTEIKSSDPQLAYRILEALDESELQVKARELKFFYFEKFISEIKEIDFNKANQLLELYDENRMVKALEKCEPSQMGKGLVSLFKVNPKKIRSIFASVNPLNIVEKLNRITVSDACRIISELFIVSQEKTNEIFTAYLHNLSNDAVKDIIDYLNLVHTVLNLKFEPKALLSTFTKEKLLPFIAKATANNCAAGIAAINEYNPNLARSIFLETEIDLINPNVKFSSFGNILLKLKKADEHKSKQLLKNISRETLLKKALANDINFNQIIKAIDEIKNLDLNQAKEILSLIASQQRFKDKVFRLPFDQLLHSIAAIHKIDTELANQIFENYKQKHKQSILSQNISFLNFCQGLGKLSQFDKSRSLKILDSFMQKLKPLLPNLQFHELATGLSELANFSMTKAKELLDTCDTELLINKARHVKKITLPSVMGEIKKFDQGRYAELNSILKIANAKKHTHL